MQGRSFSRVTFVLACVYGTPAVLGKQAIPHGYILILL